MRFNLKPYRDISIARKFSVLFVYMSLFPFLIIGGIMFIAFNAKGPIRINTDLLFGLAFSAGIFILIGYFGMRRTLEQLNKVSRLISGIPQEEIPQQITIKTRGENEVAQITRSFNEIIRRLDRTIGDLEKSKSSLEEVLTTISSGVSFAENISSFMKLILKTTVNALDAQTGVLLLIDENSKRLTVHSSYDRNSSSYSADKLLPLDIGPVDSVMKEKEPLNSPCSKDAAPFICAPLIFQNEVIGAISISGRKERLDFKEDELVILSNIASQMALAIVNARLSSDAQKTYLETISALAMAVEARDVYSRGHSDRVGEYSLKIAQRLGLGPEELKIIKDAAQLHDVGKIGIADGILLKPDSLDDHEIQIMRQHPLIGEGIIAPLHNLSELKDPIRHHHEWLNGQGYPDGLKGDEISFKAKILAVADAFDAMTTDRPYRKGKSFGEAKEELLKCKGVLYDPQVVDALVSCI